MKIVEMDNCTLIMKSHYIYGLHSWGFILHKQEHEAVLLI